MASTWDFRDRTPAHPRAPHGPGSLWEAVGLLVYLQEQEKIAGGAHGAARETARRADLRGQQAVAWAYIKTFAEELVRREEAPPDLVQRLRESMQIQREVAAAGAEVEQEIRMAA